MSNVTWQEPRILLDLLALNLFADKNGMTLQGPKDLAILSPWLSDVEFTIAPGPWFEQATVGEIENGLRLRRCLELFCQTGWKVRVGVLNYGRSPSGLAKSADDYKPERQLLKRILDLGAEIYFCPDLHAKGVVTPLGIVTGTTNMTKSGLYAQSQNSNYFAFDHADYDQNRIQLLSKFNGVPRCLKIP